MTAAKRLRFSKGDWLAIGLVLALAVVVFSCFLPIKSESAAYAVVYLDGQAVKTVTLTTDQTFLVTDRYINEITVENGAISFTSSNCPGEDCVHSGSIHAPGRSLVCLPNRVEIRVISGEPEVDFVVG